MNLWELCADGWRPARRVFPRKSRGMWAEQVDKRALTKGWGPGWTQDTAGRLVVGVGGGHFYSPSPFSTPQTPDRARHRAIVANYRVHAVWIANGRGAMTTGLLSAGLGSKLTMRAGAWAAWWPLSRQTITREGYTST